MGYNEKIEQLFRLYYRPLCLYAMHYLKDSAEVEDVVQDSFEKLWQKMSEGANIQSSKSYLYASVHNKCISKLRLDKNTVSTEIFSDVLLDEDAVSSSFSESALWKAIEDLPEKRRMMFIMEKRDGMSQKDIALKLGVSERTVKNQISKALKSLRERRKEIILHFFIF